jgi:uncharacterized SAM-binding protein YcdF (DUF218 family)
MNPYSKFRVMITGNICIMNFVCRLYEEEIFVKEFILSGRDESAGVRQIDVQVEERREMSAMKGMKHFA